MDNENINGAGSISVHQSAQETAGAKEKAALTEVGWSTPKARIARGKAIAMSEKLQNRAQDAKNNPAEAAQAYDGARKSILGEFSSNPNSVCTPCLANSKAARRKQRLDLVDRHIHCCEDVAKRLRGDMDEVENMVCAKHVYLANDRDAPPELKDQPPPGFLQPTDADLSAMGLTRDMLQPDGTNFRAAVYVRDPKVWAPPDPPEPKSIIAFRGSTPELEDWENNMMHGAERTPGYIGDDGVLNMPYHERAVEIGQAIMNSKPSPSVQFVGHSLGGGLASAAQGGSGGANGKPASTYNSAGIYAETVQHYGAAKPASSKIKAVRIKGEALTKAQETDWTKHLAPAALGVKDDLDPSSSKSDYLGNQGKFDKAAAEKNDETFNADKEYSGYLHGMDQVIASMEARKKADQASLEKCKKASK